MFKKFTVVLLTVSLLLSSMGVSAAELSAVFSDAGIEREGEVFSVSTDERASGDGYENLSPADDGNSDVDGDDNLQLDEREEWIEETIDAVQDENSEEVFEDGDTVQIEDTGVEYATESAEFDAVQDDIGTFEDSIEETGEEAPEEVGEFTEEYLMEATEDLAEEAPAEYEVRVSKTSGPVQLYMSLPEAVQKADSGSTLTLLRDVILDDALVLDKELTLDLNGRIITCDAEKNAVEISPGSNKTVIITDSASGGMICHSHAVEAGTVSIPRKGHGILVRTGTLLMTGGEVSYNREVNGGGVRILGNAFFELDGGVIRNNQATNGGGVRVESSTQYYYGTFNLKSGEISGNFADEGGGVLIGGYARFSMTGGSISGNSARCGGGVYDNRNGVFTMSGGTISGNAVSGNPSQGGGVYVENTSAVMNVSGYPIVVNNTCNNELDNVYLAAGKINITGMLVSAASLGVSMSSPGEFTSGMSSYGSAGNFSSDEGALVVKIAADGEAELTAPTDEANVISGSTVTKYETLAEAVSKASAGDTVTLLTNVEIRDTVTIDKSLVLDLNGMRLIAVSSKDAIKIVGKGTIATITDNSSAARGMICHSHASDGTISCSGSGIYIQDGELTLKGGNVCYNASSGVNVSSQATFILDGGRIHHNEGNSGGGVRINGYVSSGSTIGGLFIMKSGGISENMASTGGGVDNSGTIRISGGIISNNTANSSGGGIYNSPSQKGIIEVSGSPVISGNTCKNVADNVYLYSSSVIIITGKLTNEALIGTNVSSSRVFTSGLSENGTISNFKSDNSSFYVINENNEAGLNRCTVRTISGSFVTGYGTIEEALKGANSGDKVELLADAVINKTLVIDKSLILDLKGHSIRCDANVDVIRINGHDINVTITDTGNRSFPGMICHSYTIGDNTDSVEIHKSGRGIFVESGSLRLVNGRIIYNKINQAGAGVLVYGGRLIMEGGQIRDNTVSSGDSSNYLYGGGVFVSSEAQFDMNGGQITSNTANYGGGVYNEGIFCMSSGLIERNMAVSYNSSSNPLNVYGGGVYTTGSKSGFTMTGGTITSNTVPNNSVYTQGAGVFVGGPFSIGGSVKILSNNKVTGTNYAPSNVYLDTMLAGEEQNYKIHVMDALTKSEGNKASVGVTMPNSVSEGIFTSGYKNSVGDVNPNNYFTSDSGIPIRRGEDGEAGCFFGTPYSIETIVQNGTVGVKADTYNIENRTIISGDKVTLTAVPKNGFQLTSISVSAEGSGTVDVSVSGNTGIFTMPGNKVTVTVIFERLEKSMTELSIADINDMPYIGGARYPILTIKDGTHTLIKDQEYTVSYKLNGTEVTPKNAGTYTAVISGMGIYKDSVKKTFTITPSPVSVTVSAVDRQYIPDNKAVNLTNAAVTGRLNEDDVQVDLTNARGTIAYDAAGNNLPVTITGITLKGTAAGNYALSGQPTGVTVNITKATWDNKAAYGEAKYGNGSSVDLKPYIASGGTVSVGAVNDPSGILALNSSINSGLLSFAFKSDDKLVNKTATVSVQVKNAPNYQDYTIEVTLKVIAKMAQNISFAQKTVDKKYGGQDFTITASRVSTVTDGGAITYESGNPSVATVDKTTGRVHIVKVGTVEITAVAAETPAYAKGMTSYTLKIAKGTASIEKAPAGKKLKYTGKELELAAPGEKVTPKDAAVQYAYSRAKTPPSLNWGTGIPKGTEQGVYYIWYRIVVSGSESVNYENSEVFGPLTTIITEDGTGEVCTFDLSASPASAAPAPVSTPTGKEFLSGTKVSVSAGTPSEGYTFLGWFEGDALLSPSLAFELEIKKNISLIARYAAKNNITPMDSFLSDIARIDVLMGDDSIGRDDLKKAIAEAEASYNALPNKTNAAAVKAKEILDGFKGVLNEIERTEKKAAAEDIVADLKAAALSTSEDYKKLLDDAEKAIISAKSAGADTRELQIVYDSLKMAYNSALIKEVDESIDALTDGEGSSQTAQFEAGRNAEDALEKAEEALNAYSENPSDANRTAAEAALKTAQKAIQSAKDAGAAIGTMQKDFDAMKHEKDVWTNFVSAAKKVPPISDIKESDRAAVQAALKSYEALSAGKKYDVQMTKDAMDEALMILDHPNISIQSGQVRKALKNGGTSTKRIGLKKGKSLKIKARSSTGAGIIYKSSRPKVAKVTKNGAVKALKKGKVTITVTSKKSTMKVLIKVK